MGCTQIFASGHINGHQRSFNYENLVPKFRLPCPSDVLCPLHVQSAVCRGGYGYACLWYK